MLNKARIGVPSRISKEGEGAFLSFLAKYAILHKVCTSDDMGIDYFGEWLNKVTDKSLESTNVLFAIQLKTAEKKNVEPIFIGKDNQRNQLDRYELRRIKGKKSKDDIKKATIEYWKGFEIPVYLFVVLLSNPTHEIFYKRFTPVLHGTVKRKEEKFYKASIGSNFLAFATGDNKGGFCRDLFIDYIRCNYRKGSLAYKNPRDMGLNQFPEDKKTLFDIIKKEYQDQINYTRDRLKELGLFNPDCGASISESNSSNQPIPSAQETEVKEEDMKTKS
jgi:hypothetical protein